MTDLTEQWKKGELPSGYYYVKNEFGNIFPSDYSEDYDYISDRVIKDFFTEVSEIKEVLEPVPSYEEWQASEKYNKHLEEKIKIYERKEKQATETSISYNELVEENTKLKELLKECREVLKMVAGETLDFPRTVDECIDKINQALGEDE